MFKIDLHVHTVLGQDSVILPHEVVPRARQAGLDGVCITEHHAYDLSQPFDVIARQEDFPVFRGMEYRALEGHLLIYGVRAGKGDFMPGLPMQTVINWVNQRGGVAVPAHPFQTGLNGSTLGDKVCDLTGIVAIETLNGSLSTADNQRARQAAERMEVNGIGGSDAHGIQVLGSAFTVFNSHLGSESELVAALKEKDYYPSASTSL